MSHFIKKCRHGYIKSQCRCPGPREEVIVPCQDVSLCPVVAVEDDDVRYPVMLTRDEMRFIRGAMVDMNRLPIAQDVRDAMNEGETQATILRARVNP